MAVPGPRTAAPEGARATVPKRLSVTEVASFVGLRECGRYLRLSVSRSHLGSSADVSSDLGVHRGGIDKALAAAGHQLEDAVASELRGSAPAAPYLPLHSATFGTAPPATPWKAFLELLARAAPNAARPGLGCWGAEVVLAGRPTADSVVSLSGRADFILLLWRGGRPVLRIVECKASTELQTKFIVQLVLYRMMLLRLLLQETAAGHAARIRIGDREWAVPTGKATADRAVGADGGVLEELQVECLLRTKVSGAAAHVVSGVPLPPEEVESMTRQLSTMLEPGGRIDTALDAVIPLSLVPYELDSHCGSCSRAPECWAESAKRGAVQLSGCGASEAQRLAEAGVRDIEELAALTMQPRASVASAASPSPPGRRPQLQNVATAAGMLPAELQRLSLTAAVRARRWLGQPQQPPLGPAFTLLPGAPPSCLPCPSVRGSLVRVYLSVAVDVVLRRVVGVAAHVAAPAACSSNGPGPAAASPPQAAQAGWDVACLLEGVALDSKDSDDVDGGNAVMSTEAELGRLEAGMLTDFSGQLCDAIQRCAEQLQRQVQAQQQKQGCIQEPLTLHFYVHSHEELRGLIRRCIVLDHRCQRSVDTGGSDSRGSGSSSGERGSGGGVSPADARSGGDAGLSWLPHVLGLRAEIGDLLVQEQAGTLEDPAAQADPVQEQAMVSVMEDEVRRYATQWQGAGRLAAASVPWGGDGTLYDWRPPPLTSAAATGTVTAAGGNGGSALKGAADLRALFSAGGYLDSIVPVHSQPLLHCVEAVTRAEEQWRQKQQTQEWGLDAAGTPPVDPQPQRQRQPAAAVAAPAQGVGLPNSPTPQSASTPTPMQPGEYVQVRPDCAGAYIPPSFFRALWSTAGQRRSQTHGQPLQQREPEQAETHRGVVSQARADGAADLFHRGAALLRQLLLAQAHAVRWLEERMVRLPGPGSGNGVGSGGGNPRLRKAPLELLPPLGRSLQSFRLDAGHHGLPGGPRQPPQGPQVARASELARAALDAVWLNRGSELRQFWRELGAQAPAARAAEDRGGTVVLDRLQRMNEGRVYLLRGRVAAPASCGNWEALAEATGLEEGDGVVVTAAASDPWVCQDAEQAGGRYAYGVLKRPAAAANDNNDTEGKGGSGQPSPLRTPVEVGGELWVEIWLDTIRHPANGLFLCGSGRVWPWTFATAAGARVALDAAPNIAGWVADSVVECLRDFGGSSAYLAERLRLPMAPDAEEDIALGEGDGEEEEPMGAADSIPSEAPRTPVAARTPPGCGGPEDPGPTPPSVLGAQRLFSPPPSPSPPLFPGPLTPGHTHSPAMPDARSAGDAGTPRSTGGTRRNPAACGVDIPAQLTSGLDRDQVAAVAAFLEHPDSGSRVLLQGPPGTGKTETMATAVLAWLEQRMRCGGPMGPSERGGVVLLSGPTHTAIDNLLARVATRLMPAEGPSGEEWRRRVVLVRVDSTRKALDPTLRELGVQWLLPTQKAWDKHKWYVVGGTLRHLVKDAKKLRTRVSTQADPKGQALMEASGRGAFASALMLDEGSMMFGPQLLAVSCLLVTRGSLLVGGDHRQLNTIVAHDFGSDMRPNLVRHRPHVSAFEYLRRLALGEARQRAQQAQQDARHEEAQPEWIGAPPPVSVCALSYTHRLPPALVALIQPLYRRDGITLRGRPPAAARTLAGQNPGPSPPASRAPTTCAAPATPSLPARGTVAAAPAARGITISLSSTTSAPPLRAPAANESSRGLSTGGGGAAAAGVWQRLWQGRDGEGGGEGATGSEGLFLVVHNEDRSSRLNALELQLVEALMEARERARCQAVAGRSDGDRALAGASGSGGVAASGSNGNRDGGGGGPTLVALITPHRAQRRALAALVAARGWGPNCRVDTVERMQGGEAETVIFCATASDEAALERSEEFYSSVCRANVAFSRARQRLIVVASRSFLTHLPVSYGRYAGLVLWRQLRLMCEVRGEHLGEAHMTVSKGLPAQEVPDAMAVGGASRVAVAAALVAGAPPRAAGGQPDTTTQGYGARADDVTYRCDVFQGVA